MYHSALNLKPNNIQFTVMSYRQKQQINTRVKLFAIFDAQSSDGGKDFVDQLKNELTNWINLEGKLCAVTSFSSSQNAEVCLGHVFFCICCKDDSTSTNYWQMTGSKEA